MKKIIYLLIALLTLSTAFPDLRLVGYSFRYLPGMGAGHPRVIEILSILCVLVFLPYYRRLRIKRVIYIYILVSFLFALFKPFYMNYFRSSCLVPALLLAALINLRITDEDLLSLFYIIFFIISLSSFFVIISPYVDLGVSIFYADASDSSIQRYLGFGQSLPYQACYSLLAIPVSNHILRHRSTTIMRGLIVLLLGINLLAVVLTGARTAYIILIIVVLYYFRSLKSMIGSGYLIGLALVVVLIGTYYSDLIIKMLMSRSELDLAGRDVVWGIAIRLILDHPLLGIQDFFTDGKQYGPVIAHVQNGYFELIFWGGVIVLFLFLALYLGLYKLIRPLKANRNCFFGVMIIFSIFMLSEILFFSVQSYYLIIIICGLLASNSITNASDSISNDKITAVE